MIKLGFLIFVAAFATALSQSTSLRGDSSLTGGASLGTSGGDSSSNTDSGTSGGSGLSMLFGGSGTSGGHHHHHHGNGSAGQQSGTSASSFVLDLFVNSTCVNDASAPICTPPPGRSNENITNIGEGVWVCRTVDSTFTGQPADPSSACISPDEGLTNDSCGCCGGTCPDPCTCTCTNARTGAAGVWVEKSRTGFNSTQVQTKQACIDPTVAVSLIARDSTSTKCVQDCPTN